MAAARITIDLEDDDYELIVSKGMKVRWRNDTADCELTLEIPACVRPPEPGPIEIGAGDRTHWYTVKDDGPAQCQHGFSFLCPASPPNPRTGTIDVS